MLPEKQLLAATHNRARPSVQLQSHNRREQRAVADIVAEVFGPPRPSGMHLAIPRDGDVWNLHVDNLRWISLQEYRRMTCALPRARDHRLPDGMYRDRSGTARITTEPIVPGDRVAWVRKEKRRGTTGGNLGIVLAISGNYAWIRWPACLLRVHHSRIEYCPDREQIRKRARAVRKLRKFI